MTPAARRCGAIKPGPGPSWLASSLQLLPTLSKSANSPTQGQKVYRHPTHLVALRFAFYELDDRLRPWPPYVLRLPSIKWGCGCLHEWEPQFDEGAGLDGQEQCIKCGKWAL